MIYIHHSKSAEAWAKALMEMLLPSHWAISPHGRLDRCMGQHKPLDRSWHPMACARQRQPWWVMERHRGPHHREWKGSFLTPCGHLPTCLSTSPSSVSVGIKHIGIRLCFSSWNIREEGKSFLSCSDEQVAWLPGEDPLISVKLHVDERTCLLNMSTESGPLRGKSWRKGLDTVQTGNPTSSCQNCKSGSIIHDSELLIIQTFFTCAVYTPRVEVLKWGEGNLNISWGSLERKGYYSFYLLPLDNTSLVKSYPWKHIKCKKKDLKKKRRGNIWKKSRSLQLCWNPNGSVMD